MLRNAGLAGDIEDAATIPIPNSDLCLVKNLDVFTPILDEPRIMGEIAACNVTNDVFAMNVPKISGMLVFLAVQTSTPKEISEGILIGIKNFMERKLHSKVLGGHTIFCDWPLMGGEASGFVRSDEIIRKQGVRKGDRLILTKPIGLQAITAAYRLLKGMPELLDAFSRSEIDRAIDLSIELMTTSNQDVVSTIHSYGDFSFIHAMTDVTGFGLAGHAREMLQHSQLSVIIEKVPYILLARELSEELGYAFDECKCHETAGGMLLAISPENAEEFSNALSANGISNWIAGTVDQAEPGVVRVSENVEHLEITKV